jgi:hypothetical protein
MRPDRDQWIEPAARLIDPEGRVGRLLRARHTVAIGISSATEFIDNFRIVTATDFPVVM